MELVDILSSVPRPLLLLALAIRPSPYRWTLWPLIAAITCYCYFHLTPRNGQLDSLLINLFIATDFILLTDVQRELRQVGQQEPISKFGLWTRLKWAAHLFISFRGIGWVHEPRSVLPPHPNLTRSQFLTSRLLRLVAVALINDVATTMIRLDPFLAKDAPPFAQQPWSRRFWGVFIFVAASSSYMAAWHFFCSLVSVGSGWSKPDMWPDIFGKWSDAYTVRRFWGCDDNSLLLASMF